MHSRNSCELRSVVQIFMGKYRDAVVAYILKGYGCRAFQKACVNGEMQGNIAANRLCPVKLFRYLYITDLSIFRNNDLSIRSKCEVKACGCFSHFRP